MVKPIGGEGLDLYLAGGTGSPDGALQRSLGGRRTEVEDAGDPALGDCAPPGADDLIEPAGSLDRPLELDRLGRLTVLAQAEKVSAMVATLRERRRVDALFGGTL